MRILKQSTAITFRIGPFLDSTDGITAETGLTLSQADYRLSKAGGAFAQKNDATSGAHDENGYYTCILNTADTNTVGLLRIAVAEAGAVPVFEDYCVLPANVYDSLMGTDKLQVHVDEMTAGIITAAVVADGTIDAATFAAGAINAAAIAADAITDAKVASDVTIASVTGAVGSVTGNVGGNVVGSVASVTAGVTLAASAVQAIWDALTTALTTAGSIGKLLVDNINATISSRLASASYTAPLDAAGTRAAVGLATANLDTQIGTLATAANLATVDTVVDAILVDTAEIGAAGAGLTALASAASLATVAGYLDTEIAAILEDTGTTLPAQISALNNLSAAQVNAEVVDALNVDTYAEPGQGTPGATISLAAKIGYLYKAWRNKKTVTATTFSLFNDDAATVDQKSTISDDATTFTETEKTTGP